MGKQSDGLLVTGHEIPCIALLFSIFKYGPYSPVIFKISDRPLMWGNGEILFENTAQLITDVS